MDASVTLLDGVMRTDGTFASFRIFIRYWTPFFSRFDDLDDSSVLPVYRVR